LAFAAKQILKFIQTARVEKHIQCFMEGRKAFRSLSKKINDQIL